MPEFDWERPLADLHELRGADGRAGRRAPAGLERGLAHARANGCSASSSRSASRSSATPPGTCGRPARASRTQLHRRRLAHRRRAARRLARRLRSACCAALEVLRGTQGRDADGHAQADRLGRRGGRALRALAARLLRRRGHARRPTPCASSRTPRASTLPDALKENGIDLDTMGEAELPRHRRLPGAAHRAGPAPGGDGQARRGGDRLLRRRAPRDHLHRQGQPRRHRRR